MVKTLLKNIWTAVVNLGWVGVLAVGLSKANFSTSQHKPEPPTKNEAITPQVVAALPPPEVVKEPKATPKAVPPVDASDIMADIKAESDRIQNAQALMDRIKAQATEEIEAHPEPSVWQVPVVAHAAPNLHETHDVGEPYPYSLARHQNNELRWTINEFHWRLGTMMNHGKKFWDLSDIDGPNLDAPLPRNLDELRKQNWELSFRASRLADMMEGKVPQENWKSPPMPKGIQSVPIPRPSCNGAFCRVPVR